MRVIPFVISAFVTIVLVVLLSIQLPAGGTKTPPLGDFLSPQRGCWQNAEPYNISFDADLKFAGLKGNAEVCFDERLVPHVYADVETDAYFIQGYLHAKFRLWQMEFQTHAAAGRLSEILGPESGSRNFVMIDRFFRRSGMGYGAERSLQAMEADPETKAVVDAYTAGVNAFISKLRPADRPLEYKMLNYAPEPWTNLKTALFLKYMAWELTGSGDYDFEMTNAKSLFSAAEMAALYPPVPANLEPIIPTGTAFKTPAVKVTIPTTADSLYYNADRQIDPVLDLKPDRNNGSNNWAVSGTKTMMGAPILCNDPHLGLNMPSLWYEMQISTPAGNSYGASFPGSPAIIIGFNDSIAWGVTNGTQDVKDYYEVRFRDTTLKEYWYNNAWVPATFRVEAIKVKGQPDLIDSVAYTVYGPVIYDHTFANKLNNKKYYALRWKAHDPSNELLTFFKLDKAKSYDEYLSAISTFETPGQNFVFAAVNGDIAIKQQGQFPAKWFRQGDYVMPGFDSTYNWQGMVPVDENPSMLNPARGYVSSANQRPVDSTYPYYMNGLFSTFRGLIINRKLDALNYITVVDMQRLQTDNYNVLAEFARPLLLQYVNEETLDDSTRAYLNQLKDWNLQNNIGETGPTIFAVFWRKFEEAIWGDEFEQTKLPLRWPDENALLLSIRDNPGFRFVDDVRTPEKETLNEITAAAIEATVQDLDKLKAAGKLQWGAYKETGVRHLLGIQGFSRLNLPIGGGDEIINATRSTHGPSWRMVVSLTSEIEAYAVYPGGQSGNPGSAFYDTFVDTWVAGKYYKLLFLSREEANRSFKMKWTMTFAKA